jgi:hypothetical protein
MMDQYGFSLTALHKFLDTARAYLNLARTVTKPPHLVERRNPARLLAKSVSELPAFQKTEYRENAPA